EVSSGKLQKSWDAPATVRNVRLSPDGKTVAVSMLRPCVQLWDVTSGKVTFTLDDQNKSAPTALAFSPDGKAITWATKDCITLSDPNTAKELQRLEGTMGSISGLGFTPDGQTLVSGSVNSTVRVWDLSKGELRHALSPPGHPGRQQAALDGLTMALSPDGT